MCSSFISRTPLPAFRGGFFGGTFRGLFPGVLNKIEDREPRTVPTKHLPRWVVLLGGWCANCRNLRKGKIRSSPTFALAMLIVGFVGVVCGFRGLIKAERHPPNNSRFSKEPFDQNPLKQMFSLDFLACPNSRLEDEKRPERDYRRS